MSRERGRRKLMLRLPDIRQVLAGQANETLGEIFESYDLAVDALDRFRKQSPRKEALIREYEQLCREIEQEVLIYCTI
ncbi:hypothetical protein RGR602_CH03192 [Rhizobium gallicum bv. gallicum R602sp]|uniref:Uncharacterized protein n=1 Tax=Rhizobium gallicum bv. gallicum R602sp TaxID=1041138 RepID=A0A0B4X7F4_9HYPH|nr:hypothetical protein [Rhizobium gallicum]AJD42508.1 hypothetical protein RGR602_CH03192 [Rhizobium gallicum bv. gallicum R602sp]